MSAKQSSLTAIPSWEEQWDRFPKLEKEKHMDDEIMALRDRVQHLLEELARKRPDIAKLAKHNGQYVKFDDVEALLGGKLPIDTPQPVLVLSLPSHEDRRIVVVKDEIINGSRHVGLAIKPPIGAQ